MSAYGIKRTGRLSNLTSAFDPERTSQGLHTHRPPRGLDRLLQGIERQGLDRYDIAFRSWAAQDPSVAKGVRKVDLARYRFIRSLFADMGFEDEELEDRVQIWLVFQSAQHTIYLPKRSGNGEDVIIRRHAFFTQPRSRGPAKRARQQPSEKRK
jgi:hypothetical protein